MSLPQGCSVVKVLFLACFERFGLHLHKSCARNRPDGERDELWGEGMMIARIWHGRTRAEDYEAYTEFLKERAIPDYRNTKGFVKLVFLRSVKGGEGHFTLITFWESLDAIKRFAGEEYEKAKYYPEDKDYLLEFEEEVEHYEVFAEL